MPPREDGNSFMSKLYASPLRVYLALAALAVWGIIAGFTLPISLFPNSSKPNIGVEIPYGSMTPSEFMNTYGDNLENYLRRITVDGHRVQKLKATYAGSRAEYRLLFDWGTNTQKALRETRTTVNSLASRYPREVRDGLWVWNENGQKTGFLGVTFYSQTRSLNELYKYLKPQLLPVVHSVPGVANSFLWNPDQREIMIDINPERAASLQVLPSDIAQALIPQMESSSGGSMTVGTQQMHISLKAPVHSAAGLAQAIIPTRSGQIIHLGDIAHIHFGVPENSQQSVTTSGAPSLILIARPKPGGNVAQMSETILAAIKNMSQHWPKDIQYKVLVDPSQFIRSAVGNVLREVILAAALAVLVLFLFIGNLRNVVTAAIEIPISIVMAFILMKIAHIDLNLISLGGLALSAGMNVDGSVVVMENIFRHFDEERRKGNTSFQFADRLRIVTRAVNEVRFPIIASTIAALVVFLPLAFTSALTNALLGDLALAVVFSHGFSALVALVLVPTVRLQLMDKFSDEMSPSPIEGFFRKTENIYAWALRGFLNRRRLKLAVYGALCAVLAALLIWVVPRLPRKLIGEPDSNWVTIDISARGNSLARQMQSQSNSVEAKVMKRYASKILYSFTQTWGTNNSFIMLRLKNKSDMQAIKKEIQHEFPNTPDENFFVGNWNPSQLPIPHPPDFKVAITGSNNKDRFEVGRDIWHLLQAHSGFVNIVTKPGLNRRDQIELKINPEQWALLSHAQVPLTPGDLSDLVRVATVGRPIWQIPIDGELTPVNLGFSQDRVATMQDLESLPVGIEGHLVPLKALAQVAEVPVAPPRFRENGISKILIKGYGLRSKTGQAAVIAQKARRLVENWVKTSGAMHSSIVTIEDPHKDLTQALHELTYAVILSIFLIFLTMVFQFGDIANSLLVLVAVPLGIIGVLAALYIFNSSLSLNSVLGMILLNGIAVANSILLVDFLKRRVDAGMPPKFAAVEASCTRLRPILMTSTTTALGMLPIALGLGEGGRILQPLGIAVLGGLSFSMLTTLFIVPALQVSYLEWRGGRRTKIRPRIPTFGAREVEFENPRFDWSPEL